MLHHIEIQGFKSIRALNFRLNPINILIGANGAGKSNFISFFKLLNNLHSQRLQQYIMREGGADNLLHYGRKHTHCLKGDLTHRDYTYSFELQPTNNEALYISEEKAYNKRDDVSSQNASNQKESSIIIPSNSIYPIYHFHDTSAESPLRTSADIHDNKILKEDGSNLASFLYLLQQKSPFNFKRIEKTIQSVAPFFEQFNLSPDRLSASKIRLEWQEVDHPDAYFSAHHLSDGTLRFIAMTTLLLQPDLPEIVIIDEPELGLHPVAINKIAAMIKSATTKGSQFIISTQSVDLLNNFSPEDIVTVDKYDNQSSFNRLDEKNLQQWLNDYSLGDLWTKSIIKGQP